ncbi:4-(cytidine 5'-diphospho)-2-C-methyl-D-erythritol kinase [Candidatus Poriferisodalis sp.]|uniref:4-(cytidine 5'-diphospho)-2-C-methyl-D-erythritol kinase n=1 Tax=Candidatus Poriferisodalis sp. TaxID=3101277 RepID=UPI003B027EC6
MSDDAASVAGVPARLLAPAKLTLSLRITGTRPDGYHQIDAEMVSLDLCDELLVTPSATNSVEIVRTSAGAGSERDEGPEPSWNVPTDHTNLVILALELAGRTAHVRIRKRIPPGAGLGGGSSDAAAVLRWANRLTAAETAARHPDATSGPARQVVSMRQAASLGADVAFCLVGGKAQVSGIGEIVEPLPYQQQEFVLMTPSVHVDTASVYRRWDELGGPAGDHGNDLEPAALSAYPELVGCRDILAHSMSRTPRLAGSGGTWFVTAPHPRHRDLPVYEGAQTRFAAAIGRI